jgi:hypothetical protein
MRFEYSVIGASSSAPMLRCRHEIAGGELPHSPNNRAVFTVLGAGSLEPRCPGIAGAKSSPFGSAA